MKAELEEELTVARHLAREAGRILLEVYATDFMVKEKPKGGGPVTLADERANDFVVAGLRRAFPGDGVVAEESPDIGDARRFSRCWYVDPLDGTREFVNRNGEFAVHIGLAIDAEASLGVVYRPVQDRLYSGIVGGVCEVEGPHDRRVLRVSQESEPSRLRVVVSRSHRSIASERIRERFGTSRILQAGSVGVKCSMLAEDVADLYVHVSSKSSRWDVCAPEAVLKAAGGHLTDLTGVPYRYDGNEMSNSRGLLGCNDAAFGRVVPLTTQVARAAGLAG